MKESTEPRFEVIYTQTNSCDTFHILLDKETGAQYLWTVNEHGMALTIMPVGGILPVQ